jgi:hypothetical protein
MVGRRGGYGGASDPRAEQGDAARRDGRAASRAELVPASLRPGTYEPAAGSGEARPAPWRRARRAGAEMRT